MNLFFKMYFYFIISPKRISIIALFGRQREGFMQKIHIGLYVSILLACYAFGCAEPVEDIDRTQPNKIKKEVFEGEWYFRQTVVHVNGAATSSFIALEGDGERVKFQITENMLIARRAHEDILGLDQPAYNVPPQFVEEFSNFREDDTTGSPVAAFGIRTHFDVQRAYNPSTGEQSNVLMENMMDRPWFDRDWMRVDWTRNSIGAMQGGLLPFEKMEGSLPPQDEGDDIRWFIECQRKGTEEFISCDAPDAEVTYIDTLTEYVAKSSWNDCINNFFSVPGIFYADCGTERIKVRSSFAKLRPLEDCEGCNSTWKSKNDFIPREYDDYADKKFGFFRQNRAQYDRRYGVRDFNTSNLAQIRGIWKKQQRPKRNADGNVMVDDNGNEILEPIPYHEREVKAIPYYVNIDHPYDLLDEMGLISDDYDIAFRRIAFALMKTSAEKAGSPLVYTTVDEVPRMFYICTNPGPIGTDEEKSPLPELAAFYQQSNEGYASGACVRPGTPKNMGDVRYSFFNFINTPNQNGPLGYGPSSADPLTGELYNGTSNAYGAAIDSYAQYLLDIIRVVNGDLDPKDVGYGRNVEAYFDGLRKQAQANSMNESIDSSAISMTQKQNVSLAAAEVASRRTHRLDIKKQMMHKLSQPRIQNLLTAGQEPLLLKNRNQLDPLASIRGTAIEDKVIFPEMLKALTLGSISNLADIDEDTLEKVSPLRGLSMQSMRKKMDAQNLRNLQKRIHFAEESFDPKFLGWARQAKSIQETLRAQGISEDEVQFELWKWVRGKAYLGLQEHEVGHSLGLRHNFAGSTDSLNYFPQYWSLRQQTFNPDCKTVPRTSAEIQKDIDNGVENPDKYRANGYRTFTSYGLATREVAPGSCRKNENSDDESTTGREVLVAADDEGHARVYRSLMRGNVEFTNLTFDGIETYSSSSIMEYGATFGLNDQAGLALYDYAALAYGYGGLLEVFNEAPSKLNIVHTYDEADSFEQGGDENGNPYSYILRSPEKIVDMRDVDTFEVRRLVADSDEVIIEEDVPRALDRETYQNFNGFRDAGWNYWHYSVIPIMFYDESRAKSAEELRAQMMISDRVKFDGIGDMWKLYDRSLVPEEDVKSQGLIEVPYKYCEDLFAGQSTVDCRRWDTGADDYEILQTIIDRYKSYYVFDSFRRGRLTWGLSLYGLISRTMSRYFDRALKHYQYWLLKASGRGVGWYVSEYGGLDSTLAAQEGINFLASIFTTPSVGTYVYSELEDTFLNVDTDGLGVGSAGLSREALEDLNTDDQFCLNIAQGGRYQFDQFVENDEGERPYYYPYMMEVKSHFWDKLLAMFALTEGSVSVLGQDSASNNQSFFIPPMLVFDNELYRLFSGLITENVRENTGLCVEVDDNDDIVYTDVGCPKDCNGKCAAYWKPMPLVRSASDVACSTNDGKNYRVMNPYTRAYGNSDFNMRYFAALFGAGSFQGNMNYDWIDTAGLFIKGRGDLPELNDELANDYEVWEFTDNYGVSNSLTYMAYCPADYRTNAKDQIPRAGCDMISAMYDRALRLQTRRVEEALADGRLNNLDLGEDWMNPTEPERVYSILDTYYPARSYSEFFDLQQQQEMARFHNELLRHFFFVSSPTLF